MNSIDELKRKWTDIDINADASTPRLNPSEGRIPRSIKQRLISRLWRMIVVVIVGLLITPNLCKLLETPAWFACVYAGFSIAAGLMNYTLISKLNRFDFATSTAVDAIRFVTGFTRLRNIFRCVLMAAAAVIILCMIFVTKADSDPYLIIAIVCGAAIGVLIGLRINSRFKNDLALLKKWLGDPDTTDEQ